MVLFFTGTGNSEYVARFIADDLGDTVVSLNSILKNHHEPVFVSEKPFVVVSPIHTWRLPTVVTDLLAKASFEGSRRIYFVATMETETGAADKRCRELSDRLGMEFGGFTGIPMPGNCIYLEQMPTQSRALAIIRASTPRMHEVARAIADGRMIEKSDATSLASMKSSSAMHAFYKHFIETDKNYAVSDACTGCGACVMVCPMNNVALVSKADKPRFRGNCCACYACIQRCPKAAIDIKGRTEGRSRYRAPAYRAARAER